MHPVTHLFDLIEGPIRHGLVRWAFEKQVFDHCQEPVSAKQLSQQLGSDEANTKRALQALVACGFLVTERGLFQVEASFAPYLLRSSCQCFSQTFLDLGETRHAGLADLSDLIDGQSSTQPKVVFDAAHWCKQQRSLAAFHESVAATQMLAALRQLPEWSSARKILDLGGGSPVLGKATLKDKPDAQVTLFDIPPLVARLTDEDLSGLDICAGDYNDATTLPNGPFDIIWCSMSLYFAKDLANVLTELHRRLAPGGVLVSFHEDLTDDRCAPSRHVVGRMMPALRGKDLSFAAGAIADTFSTIGLHNISSDLIETPFGTFRLDAGRRGTS